MDVSLADTYDRIKSETRAPGVVTPPPMSYSTYRNQAATQCEELKDQCGKRILLDIYCKVLPLDSNHISGSQGDMKKDIDNFLTNKDMTSSQYLTSCGEKTKAPLIEFVLRSLDNIGKDFMKEAEDTWKDSQKAGIKPPPPLADPDSKKVESQLLEVQKDTDYESFVNEMKQKTVNKIIKDVSDVIIDKKTEKDMTVRLDKTPKANMESPVVVAIDHVYNKLWKEDVDITPEIEDQIVGMSIRESTLNLLDLAFRQPESELRQFKSRVQLGRGHVITESVITSLKKK